MGDGPNLDTTMDTLIVSRILESGPKDTVCPMFCQMNQLIDSGYESVWLQVARWIKFQEVLDEDAHRWSKPHVPSLSLKALVCLSKELRQAPLLLDPEVTDFYSVVDKIVASWVQCGFLERNLEEDIKATLRKPIRHVHEYKLSRSVSMGTNLLLMKERSLNISSASLRSVESSGSVKEGSTNNSAEDTSEAGSRKGTPKISRSEKEKISKIISELEGKSCEELSAEGSKKLTSVPSGGGAAASAPPAGAAAPADKATAAASSAAKTEEKTEEYKESVDEMGFGLFD